MNRFFSGAELYGDNFDQDQIEAWYRDEREAYASLGSGDSGSADTYRRHASNVHHLFRHLPAGHLGDALGVGASYGGEFLPLAGRLKSITILEPSEALQSPAVADMPVRYVVPRPNGVMPFQDASFDLVTCLGTLHHIPNVSAVVAEIARVLQPGGYAIIREPITSLGDWRRPRHGLTKRERGIPLSILRRIANTHFATISESFCDFPGVDRLPVPHDSPSIVKLDHVLSRTFARNYRYHATTLPQKLRPRSLALVLRREPVMRAADSIRDVD